MDLRSKPTFNILSLCSGGGGLDLGVGLAVGNARTVCHVEIESYACEVLASRMEEGSLDQAPIWTDIKTFDGEPWRGVVDCIIGGYPCQPFSCAGKRKGTDDPRHLWPHIERIVREVGPRFCYFENVAGHLSLGFDIVTKGLRGMDYGVEAGIFSAAEVGASHIRKRLFILAAKRDGISILADACCERRQQIARGSYEDEGKHEGWGKEETHEPDGSGKNAAFEMASTGTSGRGPAYLGVFLADPEECGKREARKGSQPGTEGHGEELADTDAVRPLDEQQSEDGRQAIPIAECGGGIPGDVLVDAASVPEREQDDEARPVARGRARKDIGGGCCDVVHPEGLFGDAVERGEQDGFLREMEGYECLTLQGGPLPLFPPRPNDIDGWGWSLAVEKTIEPSVRDVANELAAGVVSGSSRNRIDQLRLLGNGVVPTCSAYAFGVLVVKHIRAYEAETKEAEA